MTGSCLVVMYHYVRNATATPFPQIRALPTAVFGQQLDWLQQHYHLIRPDEFEAAIAGLASLPANAALLTFDDGLVDHGEVVTAELTRRGLSAYVFIAGDAARSPQRVLRVHKTHFLLARLGAEVLGRIVARRGPSDVPAALAARLLGEDLWEHPNERAIKNLLNFSLPADAAEPLLDGLFAEHIGNEAEFARQLYLDEARVSAMARQGIAFGYHTQSHRMLSRLTGDEQRRELADGIDWIRGLTGQRAVPFCYPWGGAGTYTADTVSLVESLGYSMAFNTVRRRATLGRDSRFELPRVDARDLPPYSAGEPVAQPIEESIQG